MRSESRGCLHTIPSREEETPPLWWSKIQNFSYPRHCEEHNLISSSTSSPDLQGKAMGILGGDRCTSAKNWGITFVTLWVSGNDVLTMQKKRKPPQRFSPYQSLRITNSSNQMPFYIFHTLPSYHSHHANGK